ncbi:MAG: NADH-quinone oxidoreductase subunit A [Chloroflexi bacterium]|nr:NADH-quinone oxidoreductase subunit A [Chloroflexota bacterium]MCI0579191.1 NADH-quinone oxidoreductase subunit A [Chloroflexota bacterium]MCI0645270.1 NADH-quinone oxidoreductase subunit A [Chloroflexota bacterium]MCI0726774.1 NADH-quinone oxidoreductase subunit A [Chloroflexota bacterium]
MADQDILTLYIPIAVLFGVGLFISLIIPVLSLSLGPRRPSLRKATPYESGITPIGEAQRRLPVRFYLIAVLFILFDIEIIFLLPWAVTFRQLGFFGLAEVLVFIVILVIGYVWIWKKGALEWE